MLKHFIGRERRGRNAKQMLKKMLATKLAILFQATSSRSRMGQAHHAELSLFSQTGARKYLNNAERRRFQNAIATLGSRERLFCEVLFWGGGRISETLALNPDAIDIDSGSIALVTLKRRRQGIVRQVPLPRQVIRDLVSEFRIRKAQTEPETATRRLWPWSRTTAWRLIKKVMSEARVAGLQACPKGLRHTFGVNAFQVNTPPHLVQRWLGHASLRTTTIYGDVSGREERRLAARMWRKR